MENNVTEIMENATEAIVENTNTMPDICESGDACGKNAWIKPVVIATVLVGAYVAVKHKKIQAYTTQKRIKWLEKHGYTVLKNEDIIDETTEGCEVEVAD